MVCNGRRDCADGSDEGTGKQSLCNTSINAIQVTAAKHQLTILQVVTPLVVAPNVRMAVTTLPVDRAALARWDSKLLRTEFLAKTSMSASKRHQFAKIIALIPMGAISATIFHKVLVIF